MGSGLSFHQFNFSLLKSNQRLMSSALEMVDSTQLFFSFLNEKNIVAPAREMTAIPVDSVHSASFFSLKKFQEIQFREVSTNLLRLSFGIKDIKADLQQALEKI
jgi:O-acetylhomoserine/O-acetylserine sulfhydrylase-like pyridoxal-dependent enzyme